MSDQDSATPVVSIPLIPLTEKQLADWLAQAPPHWQARVAERAFSAKADQWLDLIGMDGRSEVVLVGVDQDPGIWVLARAAVDLPAMAYHLDAPVWSETLKLQASLGWALAQYRFSRYRTESRKWPELLGFDSAITDRVRIMADAHGLARDWINTPPIDLMPEAMAQELEAMAVQHAAAVEVIRDSERLAKEYPCVSAVGRGSVHVPRVIELHWGKPEDPHIVLIGKGVCFDSGGLDLKPPKGMRLMKKDMGGAAITAALAQAIMALQLPVRLTLLIGAVENAVGSRAYRPGDILRARNGKTIEVDNTDAEGRLVLADLLVRAGELDPTPALVIDIATLTGAARVAVGTEISAVFTDSDALYEALQMAARQWDDPVWRLPLHQPYLKLLDSDCADIANSESGGYAGAITAALFLQQFLPKGVDWLHLDLMAWNTRARPGRPKGGEAMALRALLGMLESRFVSAPAVD